MLELLAFVLLAVAVIVVLQLVANKTGLPAAALLTMAGLLYAVLPGPNLTLDPHAILTFVIPPLIYSAALNSSLTAIRKNLRTVISLSIGLVLATGVITGAALGLFVPEVGLAAGVALGAAIAPTDPVAALAVGNGARLPGRLVTIIEGEGLLNDATALTLLTVAVTAVTSGGFSFGGAVLHFSPPRPAGSSPGWWSRSPCGCCDGPFTIRCWSTRCRWPRRSPRTCWGRRRTCPGCWPSRSRG